MNLLSQFFALFKLEENEEIFENFLTSKVSEAFAWVGSSRSDEFQRFASCDVKILRKN